MILDPTTGAPHYSKITPQLAIGSAVAPGDHYPFDAIFLCAKEHQPPENVFTRAGTGRRPLIVHVPLDDGPPMTHHETRLALDAARLGAALVMQGKQVLVTCMMGRNRSALVTALIMHGAYGLRAPTLVETIRKKRAPNYHLSLSPVLTNEHFLKLIYQVAGR